MKQALTLNRSHTVSNALVKAAKQLVEGVNQSSARMRQVGEDGWVDSFFGKLKPVNEKGQVLTSIVTGPIDTAKVASLQHPSNSIFVKGFIDDNVKSLLLDTGATKTINRPGIVNKPIRPTKWRLRTATGDSARIHEEVIIGITIGNTNISHVMLVADIEGVLILGMDIMRN
ncbi:hypothetical protein HHI36_001159 [Cryptolaemus montrouzieri]|uniref:Peptidase A2 domain-containing protein n=1 Tax=Cryptolaemus montrouzieri TaxID=559131 RepID=A0ABD2P727_9CUCU